MWRREARCALALIPRPATNTPTRSHTLIAIARHPVRSCSFAPPQQVLQRLVSSTILRVRPAKCQPVSLRLIVVPSARYLSTTPPQSKEDGKPAKPEPAQQNQQQEEEQPEVVKEEELALTVYEMSGKEPNLSVGRLMGFLTLKYVAPVLVVMLGWAGLGLNGFDFGTFTAALPYLITTAGLAMGYAVLRCASIATVSQSLVKKLEYLPSSLQVRVTAPKGSYTYPASWLNRNHTSHIFEEALLQADSLKNKLVRIPVYVVGKVHPRASEGLLALYMIQFSRDIGCFADVPRLNALLTNTMIPQDAHKDLVEEGDGSEDAGDDDNEPEKEEQLTDKEKKSPEKEHSKQINKDTAKTK